MKYCNILHNMVRYLDQRILLEAKVHYKAYFTIDKPNKSIYLLGSLGPKCKD